MVQQARAPRLWLFTVSEWCHFEIRTRQMPKDSESRLVRIQEPTKAICPGTYGLRKRCPVADKVFWGHIGSVPDYP